MTSPQHRVLARPALPDPALIRLRIEGKGEVRFDPAAGITFSGSLRSAQASDIRQDLAALLVVALGPGGVAAPHGAFAALADRFEGVLTARPVGLVASDDLLRITLAGLRGPLARAFDRPFAALTLTGPFGARPLRRLAPGAGPARIPARLELAALAIDPAPPPEPAGPRLGPPFP